MKNEYELEVDGVRFIIEPDKLQLDFIDEIALYEQEIRDRRGQKIVFRGVLDKSRNFIIKPDDCYINILIFPKNNILFEKNGNGSSKISLGNQTVIHHLKKVENKDYCSTLRNDITYYEKVNESTIKIISGSENLQSLYNIIEGKKISRPFSNIGEFNDYNLGKKIAITNDVVSYCDGSNNKYNIMCAIDEDGNFRAPIVSTYDSKTYDIGELGYYKTQQKAISETNAKIMNASPESQKILIKNLK